MELRAPNVINGWKPCHQPDVWGGGLPTVLLSKAGALPEAGDIEGQGQYWKTHYNTPLGKGTVTKYVYKVQKILKEITSKSG